VNAALADVVARTRNLFLDFDGPICSIFAGYPAPTIAAELIQLLENHRADARKALPGLVDVDDPLQVLRLVSDLCDDDLTRHVANALRDSEVNATLTAEPTPGIYEVVTAALESRRRLAVVSNNSVEAVTVYLTRLGLSSSFVRVIGRYDGMNPEYLKPSNHLIGLALIGTDSPPWSSALVGDTDADIEAARLTPVASIGYANKPGKAESLRAAGADAIVSSMAELAEALAATPVGD
jgi:phosphoglycolate phosphatase-like HAD superfamily hydrolase